MKELPDSVKGALFDLHPLPVLMCDAKTLQIIAVNEAAVAHYGCPREEFLALTMADIRPPEDVPLMWQRVAEITDQSGVRLSGTLRHRKKDGTTILVEASYSRIQVEGCDAYLVVVNDVTERNRQEEALRQSVKMEAVGRLAGGVAHDFNNMLTIILGYSNLTLTELDADSPLRSHIEGIRKAAERSASLTRQLLAFSRRQVLQPRILDLNAIVGETATMLRRMIGENIELQLSLGSAVRKVKADPNQIQEILMTLVVYAKGGLEGGGKITVETRNSALRAFEAQPDSGYVALVVSDTGKGMDEHSRQRVFEPFFTSRQGDADTGLGLATVYGIVKQSGGHILVDSEPGHGTTFTVYLPATDSQESAPEKEKQAVRALGGNETILLVEDEAELRYLARDILKQSGYQVIEAANGADALAKVANYPALIPLVVSDVIMPRMGGRELARRLRSTHPEIKVIFMSGYASEAVAQDGVLEPGTVYMEKPFAAEALLENVRRSLDSGRA